MIEDALAVEPARERVVAAERENDAPRARGAQRAHEIGRRVHARELVHAAFDEIRALLPRDSALERLAFTGIALGTELRGVSGLAVGREEWTSGAPGPDFERRESGIAGDREAEATEAEAREPRFVLQADPQKSAAFETERPRRKEDRRARRVPAFDRPTAHRVRIDRRGDGVAALAEVGARRDERDDLHVRGIPERARLDLETGEHEVPVVRASGASLWETRVWQRFETQRAQIRERRRSLELVRVAIGIRSTSEHGIVGEDDELAPPARSQCGWLERRPAVSEMPRLFRLPLRLREIARRIRGFHALLESGLRRPEALEL